MKSVNDMRASAGLPPLADPNAPTYYELTDKPNVRCAVDLHGQTKRLRAEGWINYFTRIRRFRCLCGRWEWVEMDGHIVERQAGR